MIVGKIIGGGFDRVIIRQKNSCSIELGDLLISESNNKRILLKVYDLLYGSQLSQQSLELISGMQLEQDSRFNMFEEELRNYTIAVAKPLLTIEKTKSTMSKSLPKFLSNVRNVSEDDFVFLKEPKNPLFFGNLRSGSKTLNFKVFMNGKDVLKHHVLIAATTGRGKSNLAKVFLWNLVGKEYAGVLVIDPHDEYFGRNGFGLKDNANKNKVLYYTPNPVKGSLSLKVNLSLVKPNHLNINWTDAQRDAVNSYYKVFKDEWIKALILERETGFKFNQATLDVVKRKLMNLFSLRVKDNKLLEYGIFSFKSGDSIVKDIINALEDSCVVIIDTSTLPNDVELLISSLIVSEIFSKYRYYKLVGQLHDKPTISILIEEAPRVLNKEALLSNNIFSTIAREGRKFKIGLIAITQLPSLIPREILANMNTKIILGLEMQPERKAIIESSSQDLSNDYKSIASLDVGEAIVTSSFLKFALPIKIPLFEEVIVKDNSKSVRKEFVGMNLS